MTDLLTPDAALLRPERNVLINLFLAILPVVLAFAIARGVRGEMRRTGRVRWPLWSPLLLLWLAFLPNTCYLLTEWRHYLDTVAFTPLYARTYAEKPALLTLLIVTAFYLLYSGAGLWTFFLAIWPLDRLTRRRLGRITLVLQAGIFTLCAMGVYLGLVWRFNSQDILQPGKVSDILQVIADTLHRPALDGLILAFAGVLWALYALFDIWMDGALARIRARTARRNGASA
ncbi:MAG: DUF1361 domain-containing protein [Armatimonadetes bacterium]|nr:DUF1361 domain-containing protein [Armatimonadota bacterium]